MHYMENMYTLGNWLRIGRNDLYKTLELNVLLKKLSTNVLHKRFVRTNIDI